MKKITIRLALSFVLCLLTYRCTMMAQDIHFSQFDETPLLLNPANAGAHHEVQVILNYKDQWRSIVSPYKTFDFSADFRLLKHKKHNLGLGIYFFNDRAGAANVSSNDINIDFSAIINVNAKSLISAGLMGGFASRAINNSHLKWGKQYDQTTWQYNGASASGEDNLLQNNFSFFDLAAGIQYSYGTDEMYISANNSHKFNLGFSVYHPQQPVYSFYANNEERLHAKFVFSGDVATGLKNTNVILKPSFVFFRQGKLQEITPGMMIQYVLHEGSVYTGNKKPSAISIGGYYRFKDAAIAVVRYEYANYSVGLSYDFNLSALKTITKTRGGFEISLRFIAPNAFVKNRSTISFF